MLTQTAAAMPPVPPVPAGRFPVQLFSLQLSFPVPERPSDVPARFPVLVFHARRGFRLLPFDASYLIKT